MNPLTSASSSPSLATFLSLLLLTLTLPLPTASARKTTTNPNSVPKNAVHPSTITSLTLRSDQKTTSRRSSPIQQLTCAGPSQICALYTVDVMRCKNEGSDYDEGNIQWACRASLPEEFKLGATEVSCEGYESAEDPYVLKGSCGVEYRLLLTESGEEKYGRGGKGGSGGPVWDEYQAGNGAGQKLAQWLFLALFLGVLFVILRAFVRRWGEGGNGNGNPPRLGGGGGGWGGGDDPPPPYDHHPSSYSSPPTKPSSRTYNMPRSSGSGSGTRGGSNRTQQAQGEAWRPGVWTGLAAGTAAGYWAGSRNRQAQTQPEPRQQMGGLFGGGGSRTNTGGGGLFGGGGSSSSRSGSGSSMTYESTGFGGTSRR